MKTFNEKVDYTKQPKTSSPYNTGIISQKTMNKSIKVKKIFPPSKKLFLPST